MIYTENLFNSMYSTNIKTNLPNVPDVSFSNVIQVAMSEKSSNEYKIAEELLNYKTTDYYTNCLLQVSYVITSDNGQKEVNECLLDMIDICPFLKDILIQQYPWIISKKHKQVFHNMEIMLSGCILAYLRNTYEKTNTYLWCESDNYRKDINNYHSMLRRAI